MIAAPRAPTSGPHCGVSVSDTMAVGLARFERIDCICLDIELAETGFPLRNLPHGLVIIRFTEPGLKLLNM